MFRDVLSRRALLASAPAAAALAPPGVTVIDCHAHLHHHSNARWRELDKALIDAADKLGIDQLCCSILTPARPSGPEQFRECNRWVAEAMERFPRRVLGYCYVNPGYTREAVAELRHWVLDRGFMGVKLYNEYFADEAAVFPLIEAAIELRVPVLQHAGHGHAHTFRDSQPRISDGGHLARLAARYPEAMLICAHLGGGGDWEWTIKALRHARSVYVDTSGSVTDNGLIELALRVCGPDRVLFGCDMSMTAGVGKVRAAEMSDAVRAQILGGNMQRILQRRNRLA